MIQTKAGPKIIAQFEIAYLQYLNEEHHVVEPLPKFATRETLLKLYKTMTLIRTLDTKAVNLQRQGKMGTYPSSRGQEAVGVGIGFAMDKTDVLCPNYRDQGAMFQRGVKLAEILSFWGGDERASNYENSSAKEDLPICIPIAGQCLHGAGIAYAIKYRQQPRAVVTTVGDGGTSKGDFYEAMNLAGVWNLPMVFVINNNQWAISVPRSKQTGCKTLAQKAIAAGFEGLQVDGNDVIAVTQAVKQALEKAKHGEGPTLIEAVTYRLADHTTADDMTRYAPAEETKNAWKRRTRGALSILLRSARLVVKEQEAELQKECSAEVDKAVSEYLNKSPQSQFDIIDYLYHQVPEPLLDQRDAIGELSWPPSH